MLTKVVHHLYLISPATVVNYIDAGLVFQITKSGLITKPILFIFQRRDSRSSALTLCFSSMDVEVLACTSSVHVVFYASLWGVVFVCMFFQIINNVTACMSR